MYVRGGGQTLLNKGFTLIELLAVIVVLAIIALIATPIVMNMINNSRSNAYIRSCEGIEKAAEIYASTQMLSGDKTRKVTIGELIDAGYLSANNEDRSREVYIDSQTGKAYYSGREDNPYTTSTNTEDTLKYKIENKTGQIVKNVKVNSQTVNKVIGVKTNKETSMNNYVWYSGQLWQVVETNDTNHTIKLVTANSLTSIAYGSNNTWSTSWARKWLNEIDAESEDDGVFYNILERKDLIVPTEFCVDTVDVTPASYTKMNTCTNKVTENVGLLTYEDYIYAKDGSTIQDGGSFLDEDELSWLITPTTLSTNQQWHTHYSDSSNLLTTTYLTNTYGLGMRPVTSIKDSVVVSSGAGTKADPYVLSIERKASADNSISMTKVGDYVYLVESENPSTTETVLNNVSYAIENGKVRYRVVEIYDDGRVKLERASLLSSLPNTISSSSGIYMPFYSIDGGTAASSCLCDSIGKYGKDTTYFKDNAYYTNGCTNHNIFNPNDGNGEFTVHTGDNLAYFLNNASNSFYNWYSDSTKSMIEISTWNLDTSGHGKDYANLNDSNSTAYPSRTNDGSVQAYIGLPTWGEMYSGNDLNTTYWYINRWQGSSSLASYVDSVGFGSGYYSSYPWYAVRPVLILKSNSLIKSGEGTIKNPYELGI